MAAETRTLRYIIEFSAQNAPQAQAAIKAIKAQVDGVDGTMRKAATGTKSFGQNMMDLTRRAAMTIPVWLALRGSMMGFFTTIQDGIEYIRNFDLQMRRMSAVTTGLGAGKSGFMKQIGEEVRALSNLTGRGVTEVADVYRVFAETGLSAAESQKGLNVAMKVAVGTFEDTKEVGTMLVDLYNNYGDTLDENLSAQDKMVVIGGLMEQLWERNAGTLGQYIEAMKNFGTVAKGWGLSLKEMMTLTAVTHNFMQKGGIAGTRLANVLRNMSDNQSKLDAMGVSGGNYFQQLIALSEKLQNMNASDRPDIIRNIFGQRADVEVTALVGGLTKLKAVWEDIKNNDVASAYSKINEMFKDANESIDTQIKRLGLLKAQLGEAFIAGITDSTNLAEAIGKISDAMETAIPIIGKFGKALHDAYESGKQILEIAALIAMIHPAGRVLGAGFRGVAAARAAGTVGSIGPVGAAESFLGGAGRFVLRGGTVAAGRAAQAAAAHPYWTGLGVAGLGWGATNMMANMYTGHDPSQGYTKFDTEAAMRKNAKERAAKDLEASNPQNAAVITAIAQAVAQQGETSRKTNLEDAIRSAEMLKSLGYDTLTLEIRKAEVMKNARANDLEMAEQTKKITEEYIKTVVAYSNEVGAKLTESFKDILSYKGGNPLKSMFEGMKESAINTQAEGLSNMVMSTGIGQIFGMSMANMRQGYAKIGGYIEDGCNAGGKTLYKYITGALNSKSGGGAGAAGGVATMAMAGDVGGAGAGILASGGLGQWANTPMWGNGSRVTGTTPGGGKYTSTINKPGTRPGMSPALMGGMAITGMSAYQSAKGQGASTAGAVMGAVGSGLLAAGMSGAFAAAGSLSMLGPVGWIAAAALIIGSMLMGSGKKTSSQTQTSDTHVASKIDVSNKKLEMINRNLLALNNTMETFALRDSAYFSEKTSLDAQFALSAKRAT